MDSIASASLSLAVSCHQNSRPKPDRAPRPLPSTCQVTTQPINIDGLFSPVPTPAIAWNGLLESDRVRRACDHPNDRNLRRTPPTWSPCTPTFAMVGRRGGQPGAKNLGSRPRPEIAKEATAARWKKLSEA